MSEKSNDDFVIDPDLEKELENALADEDIIGRYMGGGSEERIPLIEGWMPDDDEWQGKTIISKQEAIAHALSKNLVHAFPEIKPMEKFINNSMNDLEMLLTSVNGQSRQQQMEVLRAMFGAGKIDEEEARSMAYTAIAGAQDSNDES